jgi:hypothetical protein
MFPSLLHYTLAPCHAQIFCASQDATRNFLSINHHEGGLTTPLSRLTLISLLLE